MLLPSEVIPFLLHDDAMVRELARRYFDDCGDPAPLTADTYWDAIDRLGNGDESLSYASDLAQLPQTEQSLTRLLSALRGKRPEAFEFHYQHAARDMDFSLLVQHRDELLGCAELLPHVRQHLELRLRVAEESTATLWDHLMTRGRTLGQAYAGSFNSSEPDAWIEALGRRGAEAGSRALEVMSLRAAKDDWREIFAVRVLGEARHAPAIDALIQKFLPDADVLRERVQDALGRIGTPEVVEKILAFYPDKEWHVRLYADGPLVRIKHPQSEDALLRLAEIETADDLRLNILVDLCQLGSTRGLNQSLAYIDSQAVDGETLDLCECLMAAAVMTGTPLPPDHVARWKTQIEERAKRLALRPDSLASLMRTLRDRWRESGRSEPSTRDPDQPPLITRLYDPPERLVPLKAAPKAGRNDPCPCGSGKKYKKCCLNDPDAAEPSSVANPPQI